ncbi:superoxide dismutase, partial [Haematococcus lacustris]
SIEPVIDAQTQTFHHSVHFATYVRNLNTALTNYSSLAQLSLTNLVSQVGSGSLPPAIETTVRNSGGGAWNHAMWFSTLAPPNSTNTSTTQ